LAPTIVPIAPMPMVPVVSSIQPKAEAGCVMRDICGAEGDLRQNCRFVLEYIRFSMKLFYSIFHRFKL
jgi:hypothetical protein